MAKAIQIVMSIVAGANANGAPIWFSPMGVIGINPT
jgi:hypothetical protein